MSQTTYPLGKFNPFVTIFVGTVLGLFLKNIHREIKLMEFWQFVLRMCQEMRKKTESLENDLESLEKREKRQKSI